MRSQLQVATLTAGLLLLTAAADMAAAGDIPDLTGPWGVGHTKLTVIDAARADRELALDLWYPVEVADWVGDPTFYELLGPIGITSELAIDDVPASDQGARPLIVFSHGFGGINTQSVRLMEHLASHGFVVVAPEHTGNTTFDDSSPDPEADRFPDVAFVIDEMEVLNTTAAGPFLGRIDTQNVGVAGHSFGGMTAMFMAAGHAPFPPDTRVKAIMPIAASSNQLTDGELASITVPTMLMVGTLDGLQAETIHAYGLISSGDALYRADVVGGNHTHFANVCDIGNVLIAAGIAIEQWPNIGAEALIAPYESTCLPPAFSIEEAIRIQNLYAVAHFRRHLLNETFYDRFLTPEYASARELDVNYLGVATPDIDPFMCYKAKNTSGTPKLAPGAVDLADAIETGSFDAKKVKALCVPADKDDGGVTDDCTHLTSYQVKGPRHVKQSGISATDAFGTWSIDTLKADRVLVRAATGLGQPPGPPADSLDHYKCYKAKLSKGTTKLTKGLQTTITDPFENRRYDIKKLAHFCTPVEKSSEAIVNDVDLLLCYKVKRARTEAKHAGVRGVIQTEDSFGTQALDTIVEQELCVPAVPGP
ncbi:MAG: alpha/beta fold hydrolase [Candidatus Binatia bacterium]